MHLFSFGGWWVGLLLSVHCFFFVAEQVQKVALCSGSSADVSAFSEFLSVLLSVILSEMLSAFR